jgi:polar amino acid transport system permease protein
MIFDATFALDILPSLLAAAGNTVIITLASFILAVTGGLSLLLLRRSSGRRTQQAIVAACDFIRSTPLLVQIFFLYFGLADLGIRMSPFTIGILALGIHYACYLMEVFRAGVEAVPKGQWEAAAALGIGHWRTFRLVILPQALVPVVPATGTYLVHLFKETPLLASISVTEIMFKASEIGAEHFRYLEPVTICGAIFLTLSLLSARVVRALESSLGQAWRRDASIIRPASSAVRPGGRPFRS